MENKFQLISYNGNQISLYSDGKGNYINLTEMAKAWKNRKSINKWIRTKQTLDFLDVWERKHNRSYNGTQLGTIKEQVKDSNFSMSIGYWVEKTRAIGFFTNKQGTFATKDIAIKFAAWLSPEFELYLIEKIQELEELERKTNSFELLNHEQILKLVRLKEVFKYVAHQEIIEDAHKEFFAAKSGAKNPFSEFNSWRNKILDLDKDIIDNRIKQYCIENKIALTKKILNKDKRSKILMVDTYEAVRNAVWDFLQIEGEVNALNLANLVQNMIRIEKGEVMQKNESDLFHSKQDLGEHNEFEKMVSEMPKIKSAREILAFRKQLEDKRKPKPISKFDQQLTGLLNTPPPSKDKK